MSTHGNSKLSEKSILELIRLHDEEGWLQVELAAKYDITQCSVSFIIHGVTHGRITGRAKGAVPRRYKNDDS